MKKRKKPPTQQKPAPKPRPGLSRSEIALVGATLLVTFAAFFPALGHDFVFWDDPEYITSNPHIQSIDLGNLATLFYMGNYHPLTMLSLALEYQVAGFNPSVYHTTNVVLHVINTLLVFLFVHALLKRSAFWVALAVAALFGLHPMHVESVAWISERKDLLFTFFYLLGLLAYGTHVRRPGWPRYLMVLVLFVLSLLSKGQAVTFPLALFLIDYFQGRKFNRRVLGEKIPFLALSLVFGMIALEAQKSVAAINPDYTMGLGNLAWGCYGLCLYLFKAVLPVGLSGVHPYPLTASRGIPGFVYVMPLVVLGLGFGVAWSRRYGRQVMFGALFFLATILPTLKLVPVGDAIIAERYSYLPYVGLFLIFGFGLRRLMQSRWRRAALPLTLVILLALTAGTFQRTRVWRNTLTFWTDVSEKYPTYWRAYNNLAQHYRDTGDPERAVALYSKAIEVDPFCPPVPHLWRGILYLDSLGETDLAIADFQKVLTFPNPADPSQIDGRHNLGIAYLRAGNLDAAMTILDELVDRAPSRVQTYLLRARVREARGDFLGAAAEYSAAIRIQPGALEAYLSRGALLSNQMGRHAEAAEDFEAVLRLATNHVGARVNLGIARHRQGDFEKAITAHTEVLRIDSNHAQSLYLRALSYAAVGNYRQAVADGRNAQKLGYGISEEQLAGWEASIQ